LVTEHKIKPEAVAHVKITTTPRVLEHMGDPATHRYPQTKETADHSAYYTAALAIVDGAIHLNLDQFATERLRDPKLREVIDKIELVPIPEWADDAAPTTVEITMVENTTHECTVENPKGHVLNPVTDEELEEKFRGMASRFMDEAQMQTVFQTIYNLDKLDDIGELTRTLVFTR
jgi:2-methylcitrate dehydratase